MEEVLLFPPILETGDSLWLTGLPVQPFLSYLHLTPQKLEDLRTWFLGYSSIH